MQTTRFRPDVEHEQLGCSGFALDASGSLAVGKSPGNTSTSASLLPPSDVLSEGTRDTAESEARRMEAAQCVPSRR
jgi:hypothetical protein